MESTFEEIVVDIAIYLFVASIFGYIGGVIGASKNRKRLGFILGLLFGPLGLFFTCMVWDKWKPSALTEMLEPLARDVVFTPDALRVVLADGSRDIRTVAVVSPPPSGNARTAYTVGIDR